MPEPSMSFGSLEIRSSRIALVGAPLLLLLLSCQRELKSPETSTASGEDTPRQKVTPVEEVRGAMDTGAQQLEFRVGRAHLVLVRIPAGEFDMGSPLDEKGHMPDEGPVRHVKISKPFYLGRYEATQLQYEEVMGERPKWFRGDSLPAYGITYGEALQFCGKLSQLVDLPITLPTEAQWEYACRAGTKTRYYSGDTEADLGSVGWYKGNDGRTIHPVGEKQPNAWGLYDMHGNVWEPCIDSCFNREKLGGTDPRGTVNTTYGAMRGGGWGYPPEYCRAATNLVTDDMFGGMGIRIAINTGARGAGKDR